MKLSDIEQAKVKKLLEAQGGGIGTWLAGISVCLVNSITNTPIASGVLLFAQPNSANNSTYIVTAKDALQLYNAPVPRPPFDTSAGSLLDTLVANFTANVVVYYGYTPWVTPAPAGRAAVAAVIFKESDASWDYDLMLLQSTDAGLYTVASAAGGCAWDASGWTSTANLPSSQGIRDIYAGRGSDPERRLLLAGFGDTPMPTPLPNIPVGMPAPPPPGKATTVGFAPPPPGANLRGGLLPAHALQVRIAEAKATTVVPDKTWIWPPAPAAGALVAIDTRFAAERGCVEAALLTATEDSACVVGDTGGGGFKPIAQHPFLAFVGVVSGSNGTELGNTDCTKAFTKAISSKKKEQAEGLRELAPFLPWPAGNQVLTLITSLLDNWPLAWPPLPVGFYRVSPDNSAAISFVETTANSNGGNCTQDNAKAAISEAFSARGGATPSKLSDGTSETPVWHDSAGKVSSAQKVTLFYTVLTNSRSQICALQLLAIGRHNGSSSYDINWALDVSTVLGANFTIAGTPLAVGPYQL